MPRPRPPSEIETITFPVFGLSWWANPADGTCVQAYCGGGGSARTGVHNKMVVTVHNMFKQHQQHTLSTDDQVGVALHVYQHPASQQVWLVAALGFSVVRYRVLLNIDDQQPPVKAGSVSVDTESGTCNALAVSAMADRLAVGCEAGPIYVWSIATEEDNNSSNNNNDDASSFVQQRLCVLEGHTKAVCAVVFSLRNADRLVSSAKDGTARVWNVASKEEEQCQEAMVQCDVTDPKAPPPKRPPQVLVRGCAFGDLDGNVVYTVASGRRGKAYLAKWIVVNKMMQCEVRTECSPVPISSMSLASDGALLALGGVDGTITLYDVVTWQVLRQFKEVHELPVTCIAARPYPTPLCADGEDGVLMHAMSASADSQLAFLTLQKRAPRRAGGGGGGGGLSMSWTMLCFMALIAWLLYYVALDTSVLCKDEWNQHAWEQMGDCILHSVLIAPPSRPGILVPPH